MFRKCVTLLSGLVVIVVLMVAVNSVSAQDLGRKRIQRMNGQWLVGQVEETPDGYRIKIENKEGKVIGTMVLKKSEVKAILPIEAERPAAPAAGGGKSAGNEAGRRPITDEEINALLDGITIDTEDVEAGAAVEEVHDKLPVNEASVAEMKRLAGPLAQVLDEKEHFVLVYTSTREQARKLASRLEAVYRWNVTFMQMVGVPLARPQYKLEIFYFGTWKEFDAYSVNTGSGPTGGGVLGFYTPTNNRCAFFEMSTWPPIANLLEQLKDTRLPWDRRQRIRSIVNRWVEFQNLEVIQHEATHHIHFNIGLFPQDVFLDNESMDSLPRWLVEGTCMMFEFPPTKAGASLGAMNHARLDEFDRIYGRYDKNRRLTPDQLKRFILDNSVFLQGGGATYSLGWALVYYCWKEKREAYAKYLQLIASRRPGVIVDYTTREKEFEDLFGKVDDKWIEKWYKFLDGLHLQRSVLPPDINP